MTITNYAAVQTPTTSDGTVYTERNEGYVNEVGFRDNNAGSNKQVVVFGRTTNYLTIATTTTGATWSTMLFAALSNTNDRLKSVCQGSDGKVHVIVHRTSFAEVIYYRYTLTYSGGNISGATLDTSFAFTLVTDLADLRIDSHEITSSDGTKFLGVLAGGSNGTTLMERMCKWPVTATSNASQTGMDGTGTYTTVSSGTYNGHDVGGVFAQNLSTKAITVLFGFISAEFPNAGVPLRRMTFTTSGSTTWSNGTLDAITGTEEFCIGGICAAGSNLYYARLGNSAAPAVHFDRIDSSNAVTLDTIPSYSVDSYSGHSSVSVSADETVFYAASYTYWSYYRAGYYTGGTWTIPAQVEVGYMYTAGFARWSRGIVVTPNAAGNEQYLGWVFDDTAEGPQSVSVTGSGGVVLGGASSANAVATATGSGGALLGGTAPALASAVVTGSGGCVFGGSATVTATRVAASGGGVVLGGLAAAAAVAVAVGSGGAVLGGAASVAQVTTVTSVGGVVLGGTSGLTRAPVVTGTGGAIFGGAATVENTGVNVYAYTGTGGAVLGGSATVLQAATASGSGGAVLGGSGQVTATVVASCSGGAVLGGAAQTLQVAAVYGTSGAIFGGSGTVNRVATVASLGGAVFGGSSPVDAQQNGSYAYVGAGGVVLGGTSAIGRVNQYTSTGGVILGGSSSVLAVASATGTGGVVLGGSAAEARALAFVGSGGLIAGGTAQCIAVAELRSAGGVVLGGSAVVEANQLQNVAYTSLGGAVFGGVAAISIVLARPQDIAVSGGRVSGFDATSATRRLVTGISISSKKVV